MAVYAIGDLHLSLGTQKPMDIFGGWHNYVERLTENWHKTVTENDIVVLAGDISWAMKLSECYKDFEFINSLPGKKLILKGNHDYWWCTMAKMKDYLNKNNFETMSFLYNNAYYYESYALCGTRGWLLEENTAQDEKISAREAGRLEASLKAAEDKEKIVFLHYPPLYKGQYSQNLIDLMLKYNVKSCFYGHIHGVGLPYAFSGEYSSISFKLISADAIGFCPQKIVN